MVTRTSVQAYQDIILSLGKRQTEVLKALKLIEPANNRMIASYMHKPINTIVPRVNELRKKKLVELSGVFIDTVTKKNTMFWRTKLI